MVIVINTLANLRGFNACRTKIDDRTKGAAKMQIDESLKDLQVDHIDLIQHHEILRFEDPDRVFGTGGSMEAVVEAQKAGKIRYIGFTDIRLQTKMTVQP